MDEKVEIGKIIIALIASGFTHIFGDDYKYVILLLVLMIVDTIIGWIGAFKKKEWRSKNAKWGIIGKLIELILIGVMQMCEWTFNIPWLMNVVCGYFLLCEGASIVENIIKFGLNDSVPVGLVDIFEKAKNNAVSTVMKKIQKLFEDDDYKED